MKGTAAHGQHGTSKSHIMCRRCGRRSYHPTHKACSSCGYGKSSKMRNRHVGH